MSSLTDDPERQSLLPPRQQSVEGSQTTGNVTTTVTNDDPLPIQADASEPDLEQKTYLSTVLWYTVWLAVGTLILVLFIKGFMDACDIDFDFKKALKSALGGGLSGAAAMVLQVLTLMPLRTVMNYQYRYGTTTTQAINTLYDDGGFPRYYQGLAAALVQGPVARFGDTAANAGILALLESNAFMRTLPKLIQTAFASAAAALFRMVLMPVDTLKTTLQTQGKRGWSILRKRIKTYGLGTLWYGAWATAAATFVGHYPWFGTYNQLDKSLPPPTTVGQQFLRQAFIGFVASVVSDTISNSLRVVKTYRQVNETRIGYLDAARAVVAADGIRGLFGRGLKTRIIANGAQGLMFSVLWKFFMNM
ncbi:mitochondrial carrier domain-containing protein [Russula ochroleuca]|uniref:Mitochondrial carrier domain-containing protein n=1 Tax=Russula ochroleuca TaxID=152965 RepID=A0A9P5JUE9_9AGAM|nr:mitochondrial carrier domain-containing protein [Russula ochroleuca]